MDQVQAYWTQLVATVRAFREANRTRFNLIAATAALTAAIGAAFYMLDPGAPVVLTANLSPADRTALALRLRRHGIGFQLGPDSISVPWHELRQAQRLLDGSPGFNGGENGLGLFDRSTLGQSDFDEQVNYQRSLQGELERTIMDIHGIDGARVMLAMGHPSPFALGPSEASHASVLLTTSPGALVDSSAARAIAHLVAGSVRGLSPDQVTVTGNDGVILFPPPRADELSDALRMRNDLEHRLQEKVSTLLGSIMGPGRFAVEVSADLDTSQVSTKEEIYGNGDRAILNEEHSVSPASFSTGGIPGLTSNLPAASPAATPLPTAASATTAGTPTKTVSQTESADVVRKDIVSYKPSTREVAKTTAPIRIRRVSVAAVLDGTYEGGEFKPLPAPRLEMIKGLLSAAIGAQIDRGDAVDVQSAALSRPYVPPVVNPVVELRQLLSNPRYVYGAILAGLILLIVLTSMAVRAIRKARAARRGAMAEQETSPEEYAESSYTESSFESAEESGPPVDGSYEQLRQRINHEVDQDPEATAEILRKWISTENGGGGNSQTAGL